MFPIAAVLPDPPRIKIVDVGAMSYGDDSDPYARLVKAVPCEVIGFEPVLAECESLNRRARPGWRYLPHAVGDGTEQVFHQGKFPMTSSLLEPNDEEWSGDHCMDSRAVPGVLLASRALRAGDSNLRDLPVTILRYFGIEPPAQMSGKAVW